MLKLIEEKVGKSLKHMGTGDIFLNRTPMACALRSRIDKWDLIKLHSFCKAKDTVNRTKGQPEYWGNIFGHPTSNKECNIQYILWGIAGWSPVELRSEPLWS